MQSDLVPWSTTLLHIPKNILAHVQPSLPSRFKRFGKMLLWTSQLNFLSSSSENKSSIPLKCCRFTHHLLYRWATSIEPPWKNISAQYTFVILSQLRPYAISRHILVLYVYEVFQSTCHPCRGVICIEITKQIHRIMYNLQQSLTRCIACSAEREGKQWSIWTFFVVTTVIFNRINDL